MNKEIFADLLQVPIPLEDGGQQISQYIFLKGEIYPEGARLIPIRNDEFLGIIKMVLRMMEDWNKRNEEKKNEK